MTSSSRLSGRSLLLFALAVPLLGPGLALAQPVDDPAFAQPAPPAPAPTPAPTPAPVEKAPSVTAPPAKASAAAPAPEPAAAPRGSETVEEQVTWVRDTTSRKEELYERTAAPTTAGPVGLFRTLTGEVGRAHSLRVGLHVGMFRRNSFLIAGNATTPGDRHSRFTGDLAISYTPWKFLEAYVALFNSSNKNERIDPMRTDPEVVLALGDLALGLKGRYPVTRYLDLALHLGVRLLNGVSGISFDGDSTNFAVDAIGTFDVRKLAARVPLRFHLNFGYLLDNSINLLPAGQCALSAGNDPCIRSRVVETFSYGIAASRLRLAIAADAPVVLGPVGLQPFFEYHLDVGMGDGDQTLFNALQNDPAVSEGRLSSRVSQFLTLGLRLRPVAGLILDAGVDVGLSSPGFLYGPPVTPWNVILGAAYAYDLSSRRTKVVTRTVTHEVPRGPIEGRLRGIARDATTRKVLGRVTVRYLNQRVNPQVTAEDGSFVSYGFAPGTVHLEAAREDYLPVELQATVAADRETPVELLLSPRPPEAGQLRGHVTDEAGKPILATVRLIAPSGAISDADIDPSGVFSTRLPAGEYTLEVVGEGYLSKQKPVSLAAGQVVSVEMVLRKRPTATRVMVTKTEIAIKGTIHFGTNNAEIRPDGQQLLDEVADVLIKNPQIRRVRVEGHTDNRGGAQKNLNLSRARAAAVQAYLLKQGIDPSRLESEGYGASQPLVPNITPANRARNRRVTFRILE